MSERWSDPKILLCRQLAALHVAEAEKAAKEKGQDEKQVAKRRKVEEEGGQEADDEGAEVSGEAKTKTKRKGPGAGAYRKTQEEEEEEIANFEEELRCRFPLRRIPCGSVARAPLDISIPVALDA